MDTKLPSMPKYAELMRVCRFHLFTKKGHNFAKNGTTFPVVVVKMVVKRAVLTTALFVG